MTGTADGVGPPNACPACGGDVVQSPVGWVCDDCDAWIGTIDSRDGDGDG